MKVSHTKLNAGNVPMLGGAGIPHADDRELVADCLAHGGFPRAVTLGDGRTVWAGPDGGPWTGRFAKRRRRAA